MGCSRFSVFDFGQHNPQGSMPNMTGRPGHRTMEMNGGSSTSYLARTPRIGDHFHCAVEPSPGHIRCRKAITMTIVCCAALRPLCSGMTGGSVSRPIGLGGMAGPQEKRDPRQEAQHSRAQQLFPRKECPHKGWRGWAKSTG